MDFPRECAERGLWSSLTIEKKNDWRGVGRKGGGQLNTNGVKLYSVTSHKFVLGRTSVYMYGGNVENDRRLGEGENGPQIQCHDVGMHLRQWRRNTY